MMCRHLPSAPPAPPLTPLLCKDTPGCCSKRASFVFFSISCQIQVDFLRKLSGRKEVGVLHSLDMKAKLELQLWASYRAQTLARTVRGMMYYEQAIRLLAVVRKILEFVSVYLAVVACADAVSNDGLALPFLGLVPGILTPDKRCT